MLERSRQDLYHGLESEAKAEFLQKTNFIGSFTVPNFIFIMATMTVHIFSNYAYCDQRWYMQRYLRKSPNQGNSLVRNAKFVEEENSWTGLQLLRWYHLFYGRVLWDHDWKFREIHPPTVTSRKKKEKIGSKKRKSTFVYDWED